MAFTSISVTHPLQIHSTLIAEIRTALDERWVATGQERVVSPNYPWEEMDGVPFFGNPTDNYSHMSSEFTSLISQLWGDFAAIFNRVDWATEDGGETYYDQASISSAAGLPSASWAQIQWGPKGQTPYNLQVYKYLQDMLALMIYPHVQVEGSYGSSLLMSQHGIVSPIADPGPDQEQAWDDMVADTPAAGNGPAYPSPIFGAGWATYFTYDDATYVESSATHYAGITFGPDSAAAELPLGGSTSKQEIIYTINRNYAPLPDIEVNSSSGFNSTATYSADGSISGSNLVDIVSGSTIDVDVVNIPLDVPSGFAVADDPLVLGYYALVIGAAYVWLDISGELTYG